MEITSRNKWQNANMETIHPIYQKNLFFGQGPQSDRNLLNKNASNIFIYILLCSGILV